MSEAYRIVSDGVKIEGVIAQLLAIKTYPCMIHLYDRVFKLADADERWALCVGIEIGGYLTEEAHEKSNTNDTRKI